MRKNQQDVSVIKTSCHSEPSRLASVTIETEGGDNLDKRDYHLKIHEKYYKLSFLDKALYVFIFLMLVLTVFGPDSIKKITFGLFLIVTMIVLYEFIVSIATIRSYYDRKNGNTTTKIVDSYSLDFDKLINGSAHYGSVQIASDEMPVYGITSSKEELYMFRFMYILEADQKKSYVWAFYSEDKGHILLSMQLKSKLQRTKYPMAFTYYTHGHILIDIDLVEGYDYPENFVKRFYEIKEMY